LHCGCGFDGGEGGDGGGDDLTCTFGDNTTTVAR